MFNEAGFKNKIVVGKDNFLKKLKKDKHFIRVKINVAPYSRSVNVKNIIQSGEKYIFDVEGDVNKFIKKIAENKVMSFKTIEPDLEEIFLSFYKKRKKNVK